MEMKVVKLRSSIRWDSFLLIGSTLSGGLYLSSEVVEIVYIVLLFQLELENNEFLVIFVMNIVLHKV